MGMAGGGMITDQIEGRNGIGTRQVLTNQFLKMRRMGRSGCDNPRGAMQVTSFPPPTLA